MDSDTNVCVCVYFELCVSVCVCACVDRMCSRYLMFWLDFVVSFHSPVHVMFISFGWIDDETVVSIIIPVNLSTFSLFIFSLLRPNVHFTDFFSSSQPSTFPSSCRAPSISLSSTLASMGICSIRFTQVEAILPNNYFIHDILMKSLCLKWLLIEYVSNS